MVTVHGRTRCQFYEGRADWDAIRAVREAVTIPLTANGDVATRADAAEILRRSGADAVMVGRAAYGRPWLPGEIAGKAAAPASLLDYIVAHYEDMLAHYGVVTGVRHARKHLGWYIDRHADAAAERARIMRLSDPAAVIEALRAIFTEPVRKVA